MSLITSKIEFLNDEGKKLVAVIDRPSTDVKAAIVFAHCFTCGKDLKSAKKIAQRLAVAGYAVMRFDFTGIGASGGNFTQTSFSSNKNDIMAAIAYMDENIAKTQMLVGHSLGGAAVLSVAKDTKQIKAVATIGAPYEVSHITHLFKEKIDDIKKIGMSEIQIGPSKFYLGKAFLDDITDHNITKDIQNMDTALMIMHSAYDKIVDISNATNIFIAASHPKSFISLDKADHLLSQEADVHVAAEHLIAFANSYIEVDAEQKKHFSINEGELIVSETKGQALYTNDVETLSHHIIADEPKDMGGADLGMSPYELLMGGLGACTSITLRMYANHKKWPVEHISVVVDYRKEAKDGKKQDIFTRKLSFEGDLSGEQKQRLLEIANKCPVHNTLEQSSRIDSFLMD